MRGERTAEFVEPAHVRRVKGADVRLGVLGRDADVVEVNPVALGQCQTRIRSPIATALRTLIIEREAMSMSLGLHLLGSGVDLAVADDVDRGRARLIAIAQELAPRISDFTIAPHRKNSAMTPPSTCISSKRLPSTSTSK